MRAIGEEERFLINKNQERDGGSWEDRERRGLWEMGFERRETKDDGSNSKVHTYVPYLGTYLYKRYHIIGLSFYFIFPSQQAFS